ncbi:hypothetical protein E2562_021598 [Oryza meyeriana var. granulata]|uniref:Uncharacterized protein n=1 Tax=Oryza meyeriana var. granulata TaxID=110450 RepID=A0A6G1EB50_9ORYZ|nr:hypothetical protein E2562_021598 [Oryza meyeriana var. granulata]
MSYNFVIGLLLEGRHSVEQRYWKDIKQLQIQQRRRRKAKDLCPLNSRLYPGLRVAYIDEVEERDGDKVQKVFYSVLVKALDNHDQDNYLEEAFKMQNSLEEFNENQGVRQPMILGVREHIFTGSLTELPYTD